MAAHVTITQAEFEKLQKDSLELQELKAELAPEYATEEAQENGVDLYVVGEITSRIINL